ncbi:MAG: hypothetical protein ABIO02_00785, partial [Patescibacteria group bacterium]
MNYKAFLQIIFVLFSILLFGQLAISTQAATPSCATIEKVEYTNVFPIAGGRSFICNVTVGKRFAGSESIICDLTINGTLPNACPSNTNFLGWQGN